MALADANIRAVITAKDEASGVLNKFGGTFGTIATDAAKALLGIGVAAAGFATLSIKAFSDSEDKIAQTNAVLKSTANIAGVTADQVTKLSKALQNQTKFSDEDVRSVENLLLTFTSIGKDIFPQATETVLDMATALGEDTKSASIQLGKALQDPILGITALRRVGVNFSDAQKEVIKHLVETGHKAEAQKVILKELQTEFGGSAKAAGDTFAGALAKLKNHFNDFEEVVGKTIVEKLTPFINKASAAVAAIDWENVINKTIASIKGLYTHIDIIYQKLANFLAPSVETLWRTLQEQLIPALKKVYEALKPLIPLFGEGLAAELWIVINIWNILAKTITIFLDGITILTNFIRKDVPKAFDEMVNFVTEKLKYLKERGLELLGGILAFFVTLPVLMPLYVGEAIAKVISKIASVRWSDVFSNIWQAMQEVWDKITNIVVRSWHFIHDLKWSEIFTKIGKDVANAIIDLVQGALNSVLGHIPGHPHVTLPHFASGVQNFSGGLAVVGERGPELVNLPRGSSVIPNNRLSSGNGGTNISVTFSGVFTGNEQDFRELAIKVFQAGADVASMRNNDIASMTTQDWRRV